MKLKKLKLENFRGYQFVEVKFDENMNVIVGANDIGKSTILEALDIFFGENTIKADSGDINIQALKRGETKYKISCEFDISEKKEILIDSTIKTTFENEFLLNKEGFLEIIKEYDLIKSKLSSKIYLNIFYPKELQENLNILKISKLKELVKKLNLEELVKDKTKKIEYRKVIYSNLKNTTELEEKLLQIDKGFDDYNLWEKIKEELPLYFLFQSDRSNTDKDNEVQNPLKIATKKIVAELHEKIEELKTEIKESVQKIGKDTIEELKQFELDLAENLSIDLTMKSLDTLFSFNIIDEDNILLNKRGSGVRRLMLLSYFMAEAKQQSKGKKIIYAIEEPETSQHPNYQKKVLETFEKLSKLNYQIILTTHSPSIVKQMKENNIIFLKKDGKTTIVKQADLLQQDELLEISNTLGITPNILSKLIISVEGETDINIIKSFNNIKELKDIIDLEKENIDFIPQKGGKIIEWVNRDFLKNSDIREIIICDSDSPTYCELINSVNKLNNPKRKGINTQKLEIENYIHPILYNNLYNTSFQYDKDWDSLDIPNFLVIHCKNLPKYQSYKNDKKIENDLKTEISIKLAPKMTKELLDDLGAFEEIKSWFTEIKNVYESL